MRPCMEMILRGLFGLIGVRYIHYVLTITLIGVLQHLRYSKSWCSRAYKTFIPSTG